VRVSVESLRIINPDLAAPVDARLDDRRDLYQASIKRNDGRALEAGICTNTLALPIEETDDAVLSTIEGEVLGTRLITELLSLVDTAPDERTWWSAERVPIAAEVERLVASVAAGCRRSRSHRRYK
jgi:hypothetical protein